MTIRAVYDACVLYPAPLRDFLLSLAKTKAVFPFWSEEIRDEWIRNLLRKRPNLEERQKRTRREMDIHFPNSLVCGYESLISTLQLPDPNDRHVLAAAIQANAEYIVTFNLKDFPQTILQSHGVEAMLPDEFVMRLIQANPNRVIEAVKNHRLRLVRPQKTVAEYLATLERQGLPKTAAFLRKHEDNI